MPLTQYGLILPSVVQGGGGGGGGGGVAGDLFAITHQSTSGGGTTYPIYYGTDLGSSTDMGVYSNAYGPGVENGTRLWNWSHETSGGYGGENFCRFYRWDTVDGDPESGFTFTPATVLSPETVAGLDPGPIYVRFRVRTNAYLGGGAGHSGGMKHMLIGGPGLAHGEQRAIIWFRAASYAPAPSYMPLGVDADSTCIEISAGVSGNRVQALFDNGVWTHIQLAMGWTGASGGPYMRIYVDNPVEGSPDAEHTSFTSDSMGGVWTWPEGWDDGHWLDTVTTGSVSTTDAQIDISKMYFSGTFDDTWGA